MTYLGFLTVFVLPVAVLAALLVRRQWWTRPDARLVHRRGLLALALLVAAALVWTTPWDSWIIRHGVWSYPDGRVIATVLHVPVEEFVFMAGQTVAVGLWTLWLVVRSGPPAAVVAEEGRRLRATATTGWLVAAGAGPALVLTTDHGTYLGSMLLWFGPLLALQNGVGADVLRASRALRARVLLPALLYWWTADAIALGAGTWNISAAHTTGLNLL